MSLCQLLGFRSRIAALLLEEKKSGVVAQNFVVFISVIYILCCVGAAT